MPIIGASAGIALAKRATGVRLDPYLGYNFLVEIEGIMAGGFTDVSGLSIQTEVERKTFGGENDREYTFIKGTKYTDLTLKHGLTDLDLLWNWYDNVTKGKIERKNGSIYLLDHSGLQRCGGTFMRHILLNGMVQHSMPQAIQWQPRH